jgi:hypothetical protein
MGNDAMTTYYDTSSIPFRSAVKVKPLARVWDSDFRTWFVRARVTTRGDYWGRRCGDVVYSRASELFARQGVRRGTFGKLYWTEPMPDSELLALPVERAES